MTTDDFTEAARAEAEKRWPRDLLDVRPLPGPARLNRRIGFDLGAQWARTYLAAQEPTDAEVLAALNAQVIVMSPKVPPAPSLDYWGDKPAEAMRAALSAARAARRDEKDTP